MGHDKKSIRQNVLDGDNLPNAILNAIIAGYDAPTIINDTIEVLQSGETTSYMFEATPDAIEQFAEAFMSKVHEVAADLREFEYIDKPVIRRRGLIDDTVSAPEAQARDALETGAELGEADIASEGIEVESAGDGGDGIEGLDDGLGAELSEGPDPSVEQTIRKVGVNELKIDAILKTQKPLGGGVFQGKVAIKFPENLSTVGRSSVAGTLASQGLDVDELGQAVTNYALDFIDRNSEEYFGGMDTETARKTLRFTDMSFSESNDSAIVSTFEVGG